MSRGCSRKRVGGAREGMDAERALRRFPLEKRWLMEGLQSPLSRFVAVVWAGQILVKSRFVAREKLKSEDLVGSFGQ